MEKIIGEIERNETEKVIVQIKEFKGKQYVDFRIHYLADEEEWKPTRKGFTIRPDQWEIFAGFVNETETALKDEKLID
jgi:hypothetical protein